MVSVTIAVEESVKARVESFAWVNWSEIAREEALKRDIFDKYVKTGKLSDEEWKFCDKLDWIPGDWLPLKKEFVEELKRLEKGPFKTAKRLEFWKE